MRQQSRQRVIAWCVVSVGFALQSAVLAQSSSNADCSLSFAQRGFEKHDGLFTVYSKSNDEIFIELENDDFARDFIFANYVDRGVSPIVGEYARPILIKFRKNADNIEVVQTDSVGFFGDEEPLRRARRLTMSDTTLAKLKLHKCSSADRSYAQLDQGALSGLSKAFFATMGRRIGGQFKWEKSNVKSVQVFSDNVSFSSEHNAESRRPLAGAANGRNFKVSIRHILLRRSDDAFVPRLADPKVGYFGVLRRDLGDIDQSNFAAYIQRWKLEKKDPDAELSDPVKPITFWIENTTPTKLRPYIRRGVLAWNEAFQAAGFVNAIEVFDQPDDADWEAGDISKNVIRWQTARDSEGAIGFGATVFDPVTGQILGADIVLSYAGVGNFVDDWRRFENEETPATEDAAQAISFSPKSVADQEFGKIANLAGDGIVAPYSSLSDLRNFAAFVEASRNQETAIAAGAEKILSFNAPPDDAPNVNLINEEEAPAEMPLSEEEVSFADRLVEEVVVFLVLHEVGHTLGLTHNFSGSHWRSIDEIFDSEQTKGAISASVMDYLPINISPPGVAQGDFSNTRTGPYDKWAIEFGYRPELDDPVKGESARRAHLGRSGEPGLLFGGFAASLFDPRSLQSDLTRNPIEYAASRIALIENVSQQATENQNYESQQQLLALYGELSSLLSEALNAIVSQVNPYSIKALQPEGATPTSQSLLQVSPKENQQAAIEALSELVFASSGYAFSQDFLIEASADSSLIDLFAQQRMQTKSRVIQRLVDEYLILRMHRASQFGNQYGPTEMLFDLKKAVFGNELSPLARPDMDRRDQQILFARKLAGLVNRAGGDRGRSGPLLRQADRSIVSAAARPVLNELRRELLLPNPLLPMEIRSHRQELRAILKAEH